MEAASGRAGAQPVPGLACAVATAPVHGQDSGRQPAGGAVALLWDRDNVTTRTNPTGLVEALVGFLGPNARLIAAAQRANYRASRILLEERGFELLSGGTRKSGADRQIVRRARVLRGEGIRQFVLASNDGDLVRLAKLGTLHVVTHDPAHLSSKLAAVAETISVLVLEHGLWSVTRTNPGNPSTGETLTE